MLRNAFEDLSTEATQALVLAELQSILTELSAKLEAGQSVNVGNIPADFPDAAGLSVAEDIRQMLCCMQVLLQSVQYPPNFDPASNRDRVTAAIESGTITTVSTLTTVTNPVPVSDISTINAIQGRLLALGADQSAWAAVDRRCIT